MFMAHTQAQSHISGSLKQSTFSTVVFSFCIIRDLSRFEGRNAKTKINRISIHLCYPSHATELSSPLSTELRNALCAPLNVKYLTIPILVIICWLHLEPCPSMMILHLAVNKMFSDFHAFPLSGRRTLVQNTHRHSESISNYQLRITVLQQGL